MENPSGTDWGQIQWVITTVIGVISTICGAVVTYMFGEITRIKERQDKLANDTRNHTEKGDENIWDALQDIREKIEKLVDKTELVRLQDFMERERDKSSNDRVNIASMMATKNELQRQLDNQTTRLIEALGRHNSIPVGPAE